jgi:hypothetical protein
MILIDGVGHPDILTAEQKQDNCLWLVCELCHLGVALWTSAIFPTRPTFLHGAVLGSEGGKLGS